MLSFLQKLYVRKEVHSIFLREPLLIILDNNFMTADVLKIEYILSPPKKTQWKPNFNPGYLFAVLALNQTKQYT